MNDGTYCLLLISDSLSDIFL